MSTTDIYRVWKKVFARLPTVSWFGVCEDFLPGAVYIYPRILFYKFGLEALLNRTPTASTYAEQAFAKNRIAQGVKLSLPATATPIPAFAGKLEMVT